MIDDPEHSDSKEPDLDNHEIAAEISIGSKGKSRLAHGVSVIQSKVRTLPRAPGCYRMISITGEVLYVGKAKDLKKRVTSYTLPNRQANRIQRMIAETANMEFVTTHTEVEAL